MRDHRQATAFNAYTEDKPLHWDQFMILKNLQPKDFQTLLSFNWKL